MTSLSKGIFIIGAKRSPFCKYGGSLRELPASLIFAPAAKEAMLTAKLDPTLVDTTNVGNINFLSQCDGGKTPRYCGIYSGVPIEKPALGVSRACGTGLQAIINGALDIATNIANISLTGGTEVMSALPFLVRNIKFGTSLGTKYEFEDYITRQALDSNAGLTLQQMAEALAKQHGVKREEADEYAFDSFLKWKNAKKSSNFKDEITPITIILKNKEYEVYEDEIPNEDLKQSDLQNAVAMVQNGTIVTKENSSAPSDGAAAIILACEESITKNNLKPLARIIGWSCVGVDPLQPGFGATAAARNLMEKTGKKIDDVDLVEINDTFAAEALVTAKCLNLDLSKTNVHGGTVSMGHPVSASGGRMVVHLVHQLRKKNLRYGLATSSCGGGQGLAVLIENVA